MFLFFWTPLFIHETTPTYGLVHLFLIGAANLKVFNTFDGKTALTNIIVWNVVWSSCFSESELILNGDLAIRLGVWGQQLYLKFKVKGGQDTGKNFTMYVS